MDKFPQFSRGSSKCTFIESKWSSIVWCPAGDGQETRTPHSVWRRMRMRTWKAGCQVNLTWDTGRWASHSPPGSALGPAWAPRASSCSGLLSPAPAAPAAPHWPALGGWVSPDPRQEMAPPPPPQEVPPRRVSFSFSFSWPSVG